MIIFPYNVYLYLWILYSELKTAVLMFSETLGTHHVCVVNVVNN